MANLKSEEFTKSLSRLQGFAKAQLHHTSSDSNPDSWPGGATEEINEHESHIDAGGTDYNGVRKSLAAKIRSQEVLTKAEIAIADGVNPLPAIQAKLAKSESLTPAESWALKGGYDSDKDKYDEDYKDGMNKASTKPVEGAPKSGEDDSADSVPETNAGGKELEVEADAKKAFDNAVNSSLELSKGLELSPFLYELVNALGHSLGGSEGRIVKALTPILTGIAQRVETLEKSSRTVSAAQDEFNKSLATAVVGIGENVGANADATAAQAQLPVGAPKSQMRQAPAGQQSTGGINVLNKSYDGPGGLEMNMSKAVISDALVTLCTEHGLPAQEVLRYEMTDILSPQTRAKVEGLVAERN